VKTSAWIDNAVVRQDILRRVREIRGAVTPFLAWLDTLANSGVFARYDRFKQQFRATMPWLREQLKWHTNNAGRRLGEVDLPATLFDGYPDSHPVFATAATDISRDALLFIGKLEIQKETSFVIERLQSSVSRIERAVDQLREREDFFQPSCLAGICERAARRDGKARYEPGLMLITRHEGKQSTVVRMPAGYAVPDLSALVAFRAAISGMSQKKRKWRSQGGETKRHYEQLRRLERGRKLFSSCAGSCCRACDRNRRPWRRLSAPLHREFTAEAVSAHAMIFPRIAQVALAQLGDSRYPANRITALGKKMVAANRELPATGYALEVDGRLKTEFATKDGARAGREELKKRFPMLQIRIYDAQTNAREEI